MVGDSKRVLYYFRPSPDGTRIVFGGRASFRSTTALEAAPVLHGYMLGVFPQLQGVRISHAWTGNVAFTFDRVPHMGERDGIHYAMGCNGSGVVMLRDRKSVGEGKSGEGRVDLGGARSI